MVVEYISLAVHFSLKINSIKLVLLESNNHSLYNTNIFFKNFNTVVPIPMSVHTSIFASPVTGYSTLTIGHWDVEAKNLMQPLSVPNTEWTDRQT